MEPRYTESNRSGSESSAGRVGAKRRIETKRVVHTVPLAWFPVAQ